MCGVKINNITKKYGENIVFSDFSLHLPSQKWVSIIGPNGCGKTTLLNIISGLDDCDSGSIEITKKNKPLINFVFQNYSSSLLNWIKNIENISLSINKSKTIKREMVHELIGELGLENLIPIYKYPYQCSGGEKQLVVLLRELIDKPDILLLDEPFTSFDYGKKLLLYEKFANIWEKTRQTTIFVSHNIEEAIYLSDQVVLLSKNPDDEPKIFNIGISRPRHLEIINTTEFDNYKQKILCHFLEDIKNSNIMA